MGVRKICGRCGGVNTSNKICLECGCTPCKNSMVSGEQDVSAIVPKLEELRIPKSYLGKSWNMGMFWSSHAAKQSDKLVHIFANQMDKVHNIFAGGGLPQKSALFIAPAGYSKMLWAYSCMQYAVTNQYSVAPMLDTLEIKRLLILSSERPTVRVMNIDYDEYIESDVLFFTVTKTEQRKNSASIIAELLDKRARRGKGVIGLSRTSVYEMAQWDSLNFFAPLMEPVDPADTFKMPAIVSCL